MPSLSLLQGGGVINGNPDNSTTNGRYITIKTFLFHEKKKKKVGIYAYTKIYVKVKI